MTLAPAAGGPSFLPREFGEEEEKAKNFLQNFRRRGRARGADGAKTVDDEHAGVFENEMDDEHGVLHYVNLLDQVARRAVDVVEIALDDVAVFDVDDAFVARIEGNTLRYVTIFCNAVDAILALSPLVHTAPDDVLDRLQQHRSERAAASAAAAAGVAAAGTAAAPTTDTAKADAFPRELMRRYELRFLPRAAVEVVPLRLVRSPHIGHLITVRGIVTRVSDVKPLVTVATYTCDQCGFEIYQEVLGRTFLPVELCPSSRCSEMGNASKGRLVAQTRGSKFVKFQEARLQETTEEVPMGHIPRTIRVHLRGSLTRSCMPGDMATVAGIFLPTPFTGYKALRAGLIADTYLEAQSLTQHKKTYTSYRLTPALRTEIEQFAAQPDAYGRLARSIAPEIWGLEYVKKALLLQMVGGITRTLPDGMRIRGDINICLMGDPGVAKSQLLKHVAKIAPRGIYTSGKGSSGVGLTAAVLRDPVTSEMTLEGGSLVLADMGICCIDEFDKMEDADRTAIHEVMEQQTVSIAKAGITTTLNARTAILAAANPAFGRYNSRRSPAENINLPAALLSRFDLMFVLLDRADFSHDNALAQHVAFVHQHRRHPAPDNTEYKSSEFVRGYVAQARNVDPFVPHALTDYIVSAYVHMRQDDASEAARTGEFVYTSARTLLAILRLAQALARLRFSDTVEQPDVDEAIHIMHMSKASLLDRANERAAVDPMSAIYSTIRDLAVAAGSEGAIAYDEALQRVLHKGFTQQDMDQCLAEYERLDVWIVSKNRREIRLVK
jgi:DNA replication licensing factor MCM7